VTVLETERLRLRPFRPEDAPVLLGWLVQPAFTRHLGGVWDAERVEGMIERSARHHAEHGFGPFGVEDRATGALIGRAGLAYHGAWPDDPEAGWWIAPERQGEGLATEAGAASVRHGLETLDFDRLVSIALEANERSRRVMAKLGFRLHERVPSQWGELWVHAVDRAGFEAARKGG
jgi:RimJ/RimL family protein N-acetyltransferase